MHLMLRYTQALITQMVQTAVCDLHHTLETHPHECRVALVPSVVPKQLKLGARLHMQSGAGTARHLNGVAFKDVALLVDRTEWVKDADVGIGAKPPALEVVDAMKEDAILGCFIHANNEPELVKQLLQRKITCFAMERVPPIARAQAMDALSSQLALACYCAVQLGMSHLARVVPKITSAAGSIGPAHMLVLGLRVAGFEAISTAHRPAAWLRATTCGLRRRNRRFRWARPSSTPLSTRATKASQLTTATGGEPSFGKALRPTSGRSMTWIGSTCHCHEHADQTRTRPHVSADAVAAGRRCRDDALAAVSLAQRRYAYDVGVGGCGGFLGLGYAAIIRLVRYSTGLRPPREILIRFSLYQRMYESRAWVNWSMLVARQSRR